MRRADLLKKTLMLGKIEGKRKRGWDGIIDSMDLSLSRLREIARHATVHGAAESDATWWLNNKSKCKENVQLMRSEPRTRVRDEARRLSQGPDPVALVSHYQDCTFYCEMGTTHRLWEKDWNEMILSCYGIHIGYTEMDRRREIIIKMDDDNGYKPIFYFEKIPFFFLR